MEFVRKEIEVSSPEETFNIAKEFAESAPAGTVIALIGDLGVGKTVFTKGLAKGLGIDDYVVSPTFTIMETYDGGRLPLYHFDVYRIGDVSEMEEVGFDEFAYGNGITVVEWAGLIEEIIPKGTIKVEIKKDLSKGVDYRKIIMDKTEKEGYLS